ncbi:uncharacterized protein LOC132750196 [Ruditapes philippinarum]|uniref:uncharacterized protein LOC132750196 n=1 Tax=Ruditapes philippinarum TaxID=129788 RepID=UPI00295C3594|nr:uncharacterized protein LOC132750196 [Ruditapes philippinarum]
MPRPKRNCKSTWKTRGQTRSATRSRGRRSHQIEVSMQPIVEQPAVVQSNATTTNYAAVTQDQGQINQFYHTNQNDYVNTSSVQNQCHYSSHTHVPGVLGQQSLYHSNSVNTSSVQNQGHYSQLANCVVPASVVPVTHTNVPGMLGQQSLYPSNSMQVPYTQHCQGAVPSTASVSEGFASTSQGLQMSPAGGMFESPVVGQPPMVHETSGPPEVWVIGSSIIRDAYYYSIENKGHNLGLDLKIVWDFRSGMKVQHLANTIQHLALKYMKYPDMLIIHCGGNDIGQTPLNEAELLAIRTLNDVHQLGIQNGFYIKIVWSQILPRMFYRGERSHFKLNKARRRFNTTLQSFCKTIGGAYIRHQDIVEAQPLFRDLVHLSEFGNEIFTNDLKEGIVAILRHNRDCYP